MVTQNRPFLTVLVGWLTVISGAFQVIAGVLVLLLKDDILDEVNTYTSDELTAFAIAAIVVGVVYFVVGRGMLRLAGWALTLGAIVAVLGIAGNIIWLTSNDGSHASLVGSLIVNVIVLVACLTGYSARSSYR